MARWPIPPTRDVVFLYTRLNQMHRAGQILTEAQIRKIAEASGGGITEVNWGDVGGTLADQTDLQAALDAKLETETDPTVPAHVKAITETQIGNWDTAFGWGDHAAAGYVVGPFSDGIHGNRAGGTLHAVATDAVAGFMSPADKTKLDGLNPLELQTSPDGTLGWIEVML